MSLDPALKTHRKLKISCLRRGPFLMHIKKPILCLLLNQPGNPPQLAFTISNCWHLDLYKRNYQERTGAHVSLRFDIPELKMCFSHSVVVPWIWPTALKRDPILHLYIFARLETTWHKDSLQPVVKLIQVSPQMVPQKVGHFLTPTNNHGLMLSEGTTIHGERCQCLDWPLLT